MLRVRLLLPNGFHQFVNMSLAGVRCARTANKQGEAAEQWADEVSYVPLTF
jgi:staphylococcal nuclease domain-containing protein 1